MRRDLVISAACAITLTMGLVVHNGFAAITYIDATVTGMSGTVNTTGPTGQAASPTAWRIRGTNGGTDTSSFSNEGSALQYDTNPIDASNPTLTTTIGGLDATKSYNVILFYWDDIQSGTAPPVLPANSPWDIAAKLSTDASFTQYDTAGADFVVTDNSGLVGGVDAAAAGYIPIKFSELTGLNVLGQGTDTFVDAVDGNRGMFGALLKSSVSGVTSIAVDIQPGTNTTARSWYDGIGLQVVPEPSVLALMGAALASLAMIRRRN